MYIRDIFEVNKDSQISVKKRSDNHF